MTKHGNKLLLRRQRGDEDALLIRSAESLGRMIGSLQRQLEGASKRLSGAGALRMFGTDGHELHASPRPVAKAAEKARTQSAKPKAAAAANGGSKSGATKVRSTASRTSKRASKSAAAKKTAGRARSGSSRKAAKSTRRG